MTNRDLLYAFSRARRKLHVFASTSDWFIKLSVSVVIGQSTYFGFGFTTHNEDRSIVMCFVIADTLVPGIWPTVHPPWPDEEATPLHGSKSDIEFSHTKGTTTKK